MVAPILKWAGGKRQITNEILRHFPLDYRSRGYHEPMVGAGALAFLLEPKKGSINDVNKRLMRLYRVVRDHPDELISQNRKHVHDRDYYYAARSRFNSSISGKALDEVEEASLMIYLNRTCWNGLYRVNAKGEFNVPFGSYKDPNFVQEERILKAGKILKRLKLLSGDYGYILKEAKKGDIVYFDPPYQPISVTSSFTSYSEDGFDFNEQIRLRDTMSRLNKKRVLVILSNSDVPELIQLYDELESFHINKILARRAINCNGSKRGKVGEIIVSNVPQDLKGVRF